MSSTGGSGISRRAVSIACALRDRLHAGAFHTAAIDSSSAARRIAASAAGSRGQQPGTLGTIYRKAQNRIQDPAKLKRLIVDLVDKENWSASGTDLKGDAYEKLLSKGASDRGFGAGQYFTPRDLIRAVVDVIDPSPADTVVDSPRYRRFPSGRP